MFENNTKMGNVAVVQTVEKRIRIILHNGESMFALRDVLQCCGIKFPDKWISRRRAMGIDDNRIVMLNYPCLTSAGYRTISMYFACGDFVREILNVMNCDAVTRKWLESDVLTYMFEDANKANRESLRSQSTPERRERGEEAATTSNPFTVPGERVLRKIDEMIFELLEMKKMLCC